MLLRAGRVVVALCAFGAIVVTGVGVCRAGTVQVTGHSHDSSGELAVTKNASHATYASADTGNVNKPGAHSRAWGAAAVSGTTVRKSTGGEGWVLNGNDAKHQYWYANANTGEYQVVAPAGVDEVRLLLQIHRTGDVIDPAQPPIPPPEIGEYPSQAMFAEHDFVVQVKLDATIDQGPIRFDLFHGSAFLAGPNSVVPPPGLQQFGDFATFNVLEPAIINGNPGQQRLAAIVQTQFISPNEALVQANTPFTLDLNLITSQYLIDAFPFEPPLVNTGGILASSSGDFVVDIFVDDPQGQGFTIVPVPEPASIALTLIGLSAIALIGARRARGRSVAR